MELRAVYQTTGNSTEQPTSHRARKDADAGQRTNANTNTKGGHMTTYKHLKELNKNELIAIIKDCDHQINYLTKQLERNR